MTTQGYELTVRRHLVPGLGRIKLAKLTPMHVQRFINDELAAGRDAERCSCPTRCCGSRSDRP